MAARRHDKLKRRGTALSVATMLLFLLSSCGNPPPPQSAVQSFLAVDKGVIDLPTEPVDVSYKTTMESAYVPSGTVDVTGAGTVDLVTNVGRLSYSTVGAGTRALGVYVIEGDANYVSLSDKSDFPGVSWVELNPSLELADSGSSDSGEKATSDKKPTTSQWALLESILYADPNAFMLMVRLGMTSAQSAGQTQIDGTDAQQYRVTLNLGMAAYDCARYAALSTLATMSCPLIGTIFAAAGQKIAMTVDLSPTHACLGLSAAIPHLGSFELTLLPSSGAQLKPSIPSPSTLFSTPGFS